MISQKKHQFIILLSLLFISIQMYGQDKDTTLYPGRDVIGDLNSQYVKPGEMPGAILLPGTIVSLAIGGFIKGIVFYDTKYKLKEEIIRPGSFTNIDFLEGQSYFGARSSRLFFDARSTIDPYLMRGYIEMDFRGPNGITLRHIFLKISNKTGQSLLLGQYWSNVMDLQTIPQGLVEATISGGPFSRHGQIRFSSPLTQSLSINISLEEPNNSDIRGIDVEPVNKYPDFVGFLYFDPSPSFHFSVMGLYRPINVSVQDEDLNASGYLTNGSIVFKPDKKQKFVLSGLYGQGASFYIMGADETAGFVSNNMIELQKQYGGFFSYQFMWNNDLISNAAIGRFAADKIDLYPDPHIKSSTYFFINTLYHLNRYINVGIEWIYTEKVNYNGGYFNNNRFEFGIQVF